MTREEYIIKFEKIMKLRGFTESTRGTYGGIFNSFLWYCYNNKTEPSEAKDDLIIDFVLKTDSASSVRQRHGVVRNFFDWILGDKNRLKYIPYPPKVHRVVNYFTLAELEALINAIDNKKQKAAVFLQYGCGLRVSEVVKIKRTDFIKKYDSDTKLFFYDLRIIGKGNKERVIPVPDYSIKYIEDHLANLPPKEVNSEYLFAGQFQDHYAAKTIQVVVKRALKKIGYTKKASTHTLRHSKGTHLHHNGVDIQDIADLLGHSSLNTARIYSHSDTSSMRKTFSRAEKIMKEELLANKTTKLIDNK